MKILKRQKALNHIKVYGETFKFKQHITNNYYYIEITPNMYNELKKYIRNNNDMLLVMTNKGDIYQESISSIRMMLNTENINPGIVYTIDNSKLVIFNRSSLKELLETHIFHETVTTEYNTDLSFSTYDRDCNIHDLESSKKTTSIFKVKNQNKSKSNFNWDEEYLEGLRIFGNIEEAEGYADEQKRKHNK